MEEEEEEAAAGLAHTRNSVVWAVALDPNIQCSACHDGGMTPLVPPQRASPLSWGLVALWWPALQSENHQERSSHLPNRANAQLWERRVARSREPASSCEKEKKSGRQTPTTTKQPSHVVLLLIGVGGLARRRWWW